MWGSAELEGACTFFLVPNIPLHSLSTPQFVFLDGQGVPQAAAVGRLPPQVLEADMAALAKGEVLPYARVNGEASTLDNRPDGGPQRQAQPRDHA